MANSNRLASSVPTNGDTALWLHNKLGTSNDLWSDNSSIISQLNVGVLRNIKMCFVDLQGNVKLKLLLSFLHISRRNLDEWKKELEDLLEIAVHDSDPWVSVTGELLKSFPRKGTINFDFQSNNPSFIELVTETKKLVKKHSDKRILPLESLFLNRNAFTAGFGQIPTPYKHFELKRKAKSATLRAELLQKAHEAAAGKRTSMGTSVPIRCRGLNSDSTPLKGIPSRNHFSNNPYSSYGKSSISRLSAGSNRLSRIAAMTASSGSGSGVKRDGGIVLLDIGEAPLATQRDLKRRKTTKNPDQPELTTSAPTISTPTVTTPPAFTASPSGSNTPTTPVLGHKSLSQSYTPTSSIDNTSEPQSPSKNISTNSSSSLLDNYSTSVSSRVTASKSTPDYAAGLLAPNSSTTSNSNLHSSVSSSTKSTPSAVSILSNQPAVSSSQQNTSASSSLPSQSYLNSYQSSSNNSSILQSSLSNQSQQQPQQQSHQVNQPSNNFAMLKQAVSSQQQQQQQQQQSNQYNYSYQNNSPQVDNSSNFASYSQPNSQSSQQNYNYSNQPTSSNILGTQQPKKVQNLPMQQQQSPQIGYQPVQHRQPSHVPTPQQQPQQQRVNSTMPNSNQNQFGMYGQAQQSQQRPMPPAQAQQACLVTISNSANVQTLLSKANVLTQQERALIVNFVNGSQNNPAPQLGSVLAIKLSEAIETRAQPSGSIARCFVETYFQMNYNSMLHRSLEMVKQVDDSFRPELNQAAANHIRIHNLPIPFPMANSQPANNNIRPIMQQGRMNQTGGSQPQYHLQQRV